ncbi:HNH endonuclease signature motif containing protein [Mycolicibacterium parafortuitum]|uniref:HNH endonuclease signature motif containing protein n=1 Tax=Mycolicibacterium parafortuitum TaxID=39692 RepID=UPI0009F37281|nr:HNH endonuclease signature motif containing protein [Mycolicibacterium parafortuitum]ORB25537.1 endonuclease [Mycolicibacterium parafortuitum]
MFEQILTAVADARGPGAGVRACARLENAACAARLGFMADMLAVAYAASGSADREQWRCDNWSAVCAQIGAAHAVTSGVVSGLLMDAVTLRERLPKVAAVFADGLIAYRLVHMICTRTMLVKDADALRALDSELAEALRTWGAKSFDQSEDDVDALVLLHDPLALRRGESSSRGHHVDVAAEPATGTSYVTATVSATDGEAFDRRLDALARTVCSRDPRDLDQRRAAAVGAVGFGWDRLPCLCENDDCDAAAKPAAGGVVIHVVARREASDANSDGGPSDSDGPREPEPEPEREPTRDLTAQRRALAGKRPPLLPRPWHSFTLTGLVGALEDGRGELCTVGPATILGGAVIPAPVAAQAAMYATVRELIHPGQAPPEPRYRPSRRLAEFVRCRDQTCRFPGCTKPSTSADIDHTIPYPYGPTCASNLACLCREHHLLKTFWPGWSSRQYPDGRIVWTDPEGIVTTTYPGSRLLFPELCVPTAEFTNRRPPLKHTEGLTMPKRTTTRARARRQRIDDERRRNADDLNGSELEPPGETPQW